MNTENEIKLNELTGAYSQLCIQISHMEGCKTAIGSQITELRDLIDSENQLSDEQKALMEKAGCPDCG